MTPVVHSAGCVLNRRADNTLLRHPPSPPPTVPPPDLPGTSGRTARNADHRGKPNRRHPQFSGGRTLARTLLLQKSQNGTDQNGQRANHCSRRRVKLGPRHHGCALPPGSTIRLPAQVEGSVITDGSRHLHRLSPTPPTSRRKRSLSSLQNRLRLVQRGIQTTATLFSLPLVGRAGVRGVANEPCNPAVCIRLTDRLARHGRTSFDHPFPRLTVIRNQNGFNLFLTFLAREIFAHS